MTKELPAASCGTEQPPARKIPHNDDLYRKLAVQELTLHLKRGGALLEHCQDLAESAYGDQLGPINGAARLMKANAALAKALTEMAQVERRSRRIVETVQRPDPKIAELNARFSALLKNEEFCAFLERGLRRLVEKPAQKDEEPPLIEYSI